MNVNFLLIDWQIIFDRTTSSLDIQNGWTDSKKEWDFYPYNNSEKTRVN